MDRDYSIVLPPGTKLDDGSIELTEVLGIGGFGITYKAMDLDNNSEIVIKEYFPSALKTVRREGKNVVVGPEEREQFERFRRTFHREARVINRFEGHPNIVSVYFAIEQENGTAYYAMEYLHGETLGKMIRHSGRMDPVKAFRLLEPIMHALTAIHKEGVFHRDISPENVYLSQEDGEIVPKLIDFGAAYVAMNNYTHTLPPVGKRGFSPPEQNMGIDKQGSWTDVYALCATYYQAITGKTPPASADLIMGNAVLKKPNEYENVSMPEKAQSVLLKGMDTNRQNRIQTVEEFETQMADSLGIATEVIKPIFSVDIPSDLHIDDGTKITEKKEFTFGACIIDNLVFLVGVITVFLRIQQSTWLNEQIFLVFFIFFFVLNLCLNFLFAVAANRTVGIQMINGNLRDNKQGQNAKLRLLCFCLLHDLGPISFIDEIIAFIGKNEPLAYSISDFHFVSERKGETKVSRVESPYSVLSTQLIVQNGTMKGKVYSLKKTNIIGREKGMVDFLITGDDRVSRMHCEINQKGEGWFIIDMNSSNGTMVNNEIIKPKIPHCLQSGDTIYIGGQEIIFKS